MKEYVIDANGMNEKELNRTIKEQAKYHDKLIIDNPDSKHNICAGLTEDVEIEINGSAGYFVGTMAHGPLEQWLMDQGYTSQEMQAGLLETI